MRSPARVGGLALEKAHEPAPNGAVLTSHPSIIFLDGLFELGDNMLAGHQQDIQAERDRKLEAAREHRKNRRRGPRDG